MSKKTKKEKRAAKIEMNGSPSYRRAESELARMKHRDLQRAAVVRGMDFEEVVRSGVPELASWFCRNYDLPQFIDKINEFDDWRDEQLKGRGYEEGSPFFHASLRLGFVATKDEEGNTTSVKKPRLKGVDKPKKEKKERVEGTKVFKGTKKAMTYELTKESYKLSKSKDPKIKPLTKDEIIEKVKEAFPDANEKSVGIWYKRALNECKK